MKNIKNFLLLPIFIESCSTETAGNINTGSLKECLEGVTSKLFLAQAGFSFATLADFKDITKWKEAIANRNILPLFDVFEVASANTEATKYETGSFVYTTKKEVKKMVAESYLSPCSHAELKKVENSTYTQVFEVTERGEILGVYATGGVKVKGQDVSNFDVSIRERPTNDKPAYSMITVTYRDFEEFEDSGIVVKPTWDPNSLNGIFGLHLKVISANATAITFTANAGCGSNLYNGLVLADMSLEDASGADQSPSSLTNTDGIYTLSGTAFESGTLSTDGTVTDGDLTYEAPDVPVVIV